MADNKAAAASNTDQELQQPQFSYPVQPSFATNNSYYMPPSNNALSPSSTNVPYYSPSSSGQPAPSVPSNQVYQGYPYAPQQLPPPQSFQNPSYPPTFQASYNPMPPSSYVAMMNPAELKPGMGSLLEVSRGVAPYETLEALYLRTGRALFGLAVTQMVFWFPLGFLYFIGLTPYVRGRQQLGVSIFFFIISLAAFIVLVSFGYFTCYYSYNSYYCFSNIGYKFFAFCTLPQIVLSAASMGLSVRHAWLESIMRAVNNQRFMQTYGDFADRSC